LCRITHDVPRQALETTIRKLAWARVKGDTLGLAVQAMYAIVGLSIGYVIGNRRAIACIFLWYTLQPLFYFTLASYIPGVKDLVLKDSEPLPDGEIRDRIEGIAKQIGYTKTGVDVYIVPDGGPDGKAQNKSNAYCVNILGLRYVAITRSFYSSFGPEEITAVITHELGHWYHKHSLWGFIFRNPKILISLGFWLLMEEPKLFQDFGFGPQDFDQDVNGRTIYPPVIAFLLYQLVGMAIQPLFMACRNAISQLCEYQADRFTALMGYGDAQCSGLRKSSKQDPLMEEDDWMYLMSVATHPRIKDRIQAIEKCNKARKGFKVE